MANAVVTARAIGYVDEDGNTGHARRGENVSLSSSEFDRLSALGAVAKAGSDEANAAEANPAPGLASEQAGAPGHPETLEKQGLGETGGAGFNAVDQDGEPLDKGDSLPGGDDEAPEGYPGTHKELDALAADNDFEYPEGTKTVADKQAALAQAGVAPPADES